MLMTTFCGLEALILVSRPSLNHKNVFFVTFCIKCCHWSEKKTINEWPYCQNILAWNFYAGTFRVTQKWQNQAFVI